MGEPLSVWMVLVPIAVLLTPFVVLPRFVELRDRQNVRIAGAAGLVAVLYVTSTFSVASYTRAAVGGEVIRLIPLLQFDSALLATTWIPDQLMIGVTYMLFMSVIFSRNLRNAFWATFVLFGIGIESNQALANMSGITPPFRIDIHDIAIRTAGIALGLLLVQRLRDRLISRAQMMYHANAAPIAHAANQAPSATPTP
jgi:hypothetical protein